VAILTSAAGPYGRRGNGTAARANRPGAPWTRSGGGARSAFR